MRSVVQTSGLSPSVVIRVTINSTSNGLKIILSEIRSASCVHYALIMFWYRRSTMHDVVALKILLKDRPKLCN
jgi:hypothetical protein